MVSIEVENAASPEVALLEPANGERVIAGQPVRVRARSADATQLWIALNGSRAWVTDATTIEATWRPEAGRHVIVAGAERPGSPDALDDATIVAVPAPTGDSDPTPAASPGGGEPGSGAPTTTTPSRPSAAAPSRSGAGGTPSASRPTPGRRTPARSSTSAPLGAPAPPAVPAPASSVPTAGPATGDARQGRTGTGLRAPADRAAATEPPIAKDDEPGLADRVWDVVGDSRRAAIAAGIPVLLLVALALYLLLQRFIDGGPKLAWRGRHRPDDMMVEF